MDVVIGQPTAFQVDFGEGNTGFTTVGFTLKNTDGTTSPAPAAARSTTGVTEVGNGLYQVTLTFYKAWTGYIEWDSGGALTNDIADESITVLSSGPSAAVTYIPQHHLVSFKEVGPPNTPQEIKRLRRQNMDFCRKLGQPVIFRHMWNVDDVNSGLAKKCPSCFDNAYEQVRNDCAVCYGFGFVSVEDEPTGTYYVDQYNQVVLGDPGTHVRAPRYGGFDKPWLTWIVEPDVAVDVFRINEQGVMIQTYDAQGVAPWYPKLGDNDLCINVTLAPGGYNITGSQERFQLKMVQQVTMRGFGVKSNSQGQPFLVAQTFQMSRVPENVNVEAVPYNVT